MVYSLYFGSVQYVFSFPFTFLTRVLVQFLCITQCLLYVYMKCIYIYQLPHNPLLFLWSYNVYTIHFNEIKSFWWVFMSHVSPTHIGYGGLWRVLATGFTRVDYVCSNNTYTKLDEIHYDTIRKVRELNWKLSQKVE